MTFERIQELLELLPDNSSYFADVLNYTPELDAVNRFLCAYKDLMFGYRYIVSLCNENKHLPLDLEDESLIKLYAYLKYKQTDNDLSFALSIHHPSNKILEDCIKAALFTDESYEGLSKKMGIPVKVLEYYQDLFYNIRDRKKEALFIANIVYPDTRLVEYSESYVKNEAKGTLLIRSAYNNGVDDSLYMMGLKTSSDVFASGITAADAASELEASIMINGLYLARNGYINQRTATGVSNAKNLLIAAKQSGVDSGNANKDMPMGDAMWQALQDIKGPEKDRKLDLIQKNELAKLSE